MVKNLEVCSAHAMAVRYALSTWSLAGCRQVQVCQPSTTINGPVSLGCQTIGICLSPTLDIAVIDWLVGSWFSFGARIRILYHLSLQNSEVTAILIVYLQLILSQRSLKTILVFVFIGCFLVFVFQLLQSSASSNLLILSHILHFRFYLCLLFHLVHLFLPLTHWESYSHFDFIVLFLHLGHA